MAISPLDITAPLGVTAPEAGGAGQPGPVQTAPGGTFQTMPADPSQPKYNPTVRYDRGQEASPGPAVEGGTIPAAGSTTPPSGAGAPAYMAHEEAMIQDHMGALRDLAVAKLSQGDYAGSKAASEAFTAMGTQLMAAKQFQQLQQTLEQARSGQGLPVGQSVSVPLGGGAKLDLQGPSRLSPESEDVRTGMEQQSGRPLQPGELSNELQKRRLALMEARGESFGGIRKITVIDSQTGQVRTTNMTEFTKMDKEDPGRFIDVAPALQTGAAPGEVLSRSATLQALKGGLQKVEGQRALVETFMDTAGKNLNLVKQLNDAVERTDVPLLNKLLIPAKIQIQGDTDAAGLQMALRVAVGEASKILASASANNIVAEQERARIDAGINSAQTPAQLRKVIQILEADIENRRTSYDTRRATLQQQIGALGTGGQQPQVDLTKPQSKLPPGWRVKQ